MIKIPEGFEQLSDPESIAMRTQFLHDLGVLITTWNTFEFLMEFAIFKIVKISPVHSSIMLGGLQHKAKVNILKSLLKKEGKDAEVSAIKTALSYAKRNDLIHGVPGLNEADGKIGTAFRSVQDKYQITTRDFSSEEFTKHVYRFCVLADEAAFALGVDWNNPVIKKEVNDYARRAGFALPD